eukprot:6319362-Amphidinium_carterae.1
MASRIETQDSYCLTTSAADVTRDWLLTPSWPTYMFYASHSFTAYTHPRMDYISPAYDLHL